MLQRGEVDWPKQVEHFGVINKQTKASQKKQNGNIIFFDGGFSENVSFCFEGSQRDATRGGKVTGVP